MRAWCFCCTIECATVNGLDNCSYQLIGMYIDLTNDYNAHFNNEIKNKR
jgi:hypothetical protein